MKPWITTTQIEELSITLPQGSVMSISPAKALKIREIFIPEVWSSLTSTSKLHRRHLIEAAQCIPCSVSILQSRRNAASRMSVSLPDNKVLLISKSITQDLFDSADLIFITKKIKVDGQKLILPEAGKWHRHPFLSSCGAKKIA